MKELNIGMIGLDTSHAVAFTKLLNDPSDNNYLTEGRVTCAYPGGSSHFPLSMARVREFTDEVKEKYGVAILNSIEEIAVQSDAILLESVDGTQHLEQFREIVQHQKPVFIDKPFSISAKDAKEIIRLSEKYNTPIMSSSALRYAEGLTSIFDIPIKGRIIGADCFGPMEIQETQPGFFWYGIHTIEMLFSVFGRGAVEVSVTTNEDYDLLIGIWKDRKIGTVRGNRKGNYQFGGVLHYEHGSEYVYINDGQKPFYASLLEKILLFFQSGISPLDIRETLEIINFTEAANESRISGGKVKVS